MEPAAHWGTLSPGAPAVQRYLYRDGSVQAVLPVRVVRDEPDRLVSWLAPGTPILYWALADGRDPRSVPLSKRFSQPLTTAPRRWQGGGVLRVLLRDAGYQVLHSWAPDGTFHGWYVNLETRAERHGNRVDCVDLHLDLLVDPLLQAAWKDEDEAGEAMARGHLDPDDLRTARATGERIVAHLADWPRPVGDWRPWRPPASWRPPDLPAGAGIASPGRRRAVSQDSLASGPVGRSGGRSGPAGRKGGA